MDHITILGRSHGNRRLRGIDIGAVIVLLTSLIFWFCHISAWCCLMSGRSLKETLLQSSASSVIRRLGSTRTYMKFLRSIGCCWGFILLLATINKIIFGQIIRVRRSYFDLPLDTNFILFYELFRRLRFSAGLKKQRWRTTGCWSYVRWFSTMQIVQFVLVYIPLSQLEVGWFHWMWIKFN